MTTLTELATAKYVLLTTFRKDGTAVSSPLWVVPDGAGIAVWTPTESWKVKRVRRDGRVTVAPCTFSGTPTGDNVEATARIGVSADTDRVRKALGRKYGLSGRLTVWGSKLRRGADGTIAIMIEAAGDATTDTAEAGTGGEPRPTA